MGTPKGMEFAKSILEKYGWKEGKGLGRREDGIARALKPKIKLDTAGIGHDPAKEFTNHWWQKQYDQTAQGLRVVVTEDGVHVGTSSNRQAHSRSNHPRQRFVQGRTQRSPGSRHRLRSRHYPSPASSAADDRMSSRRRRPIINNSSSSSSSSSSEAETPSSATLSDEQLFRACGGRTAHKGARHGLSLSGKLARVQEQEQSMLATQAGADGAAKVSKRKKKCKKKQ